ncbi:MAG: agmatinase family protein [Cryomorphaceae bacterium]|nr:agmatinase family protein [Cryomorphaceae bacterium]
MTKEDKIKSFDVNGVSVHNQLFGLPFDEAESDIIVIPVPWEVTVSYGTGTMDGPRAIFEASMQVDLFQPQHPDFWKKGMFMLSEPERLRKLSMELRPLVESHIDCLVAGEEPNHEVLDRINRGCEEMVDWVEETAGRLISEGKKVILLGGDHSTPLGMLKALAGKHESFGVLQIDAHADLRNAYEGFTYSHASISYNFMQLPQIEKLVQVGIRDYCHEEFNLAEKDPRISVFYDRDIQGAQFSGQTWEAICNRVISALPQKVYITFDIDGLDPRFCPNTGTPVAGGYTPAQILYLVEQLIASGKEVIGFDINEVGVGEGEWDANVAARLLFSISATAYSN